MLCAMQQHELLGFCILHQLTAGTKQILPTAFVKTSQQQRIASEESAIRKQKPTIS
jgi:hypothetical protein